MPDVVSELITTVAMDLTLTTMVAAGESVQPDFLPQRSKVLGRS